MKNQVRLTSAALCLFFLFCFVKSQAQHSADIGFEFQAYPTGLIPGLRLEVPLSEHYAASFRLGYNHIRHGDAGKHEDERGQGWGGTIGLKRYFAEGKKGWFAGVRTDLWFNSIDWKDNIGQPDEAVGNTDIVVVQPTLELGYCLRKTESWFLAPSLAFGREWNVHTDGSPTGEGPILLAGFTVGF